MARCWQAQSACLGLRNTCQMLVVITSRKCLNFFRKTLRDMGNVAYLCNVNQWDWLSGWHSREGQAFIDTTQNYKSSRHHRRLFLFPLEIAPHEHLIVIRTICYVTGDGNGSPAFKDNYLQSRFIVFEILLDASGQSARIVVGCDIQKNPIGLSYRFHQSTANRGFTRDGFQFK